MTRIPRILIALAALALVALVPGTAAARSHHRHSHARHHAESHHRARTRTLAPTATTGDAGTIASFTGGVLTITLANGDSIHGTVDASTEIECVMPGATDQQDDQGEDSGDSQQSSTPTPRAADDGGGDSSGSGDDSQGDSGDQGDTSCDMSALTPGATVHEAELKITSAGATFEKVAVDVPATTTTTADS